MATKLGTKRKEPRKPMKRRTSLVSSEDNKLDDLFREFIRERAMKEVGGCQKCLRPKFDKPREDGTYLPAWKTLDTCHMFTRDFKSVRWDIDNAAGCCGGCHRYIDSHSEEKIAFFKSLLGETGYELLMVRAYKPNKPDKEAIRLHLTAKIKELEDE